MKDAKRIPSAAAVFAAVLVSAGPAATAPAQPSAEVEARAVREAGRVTEFAMYTQWMDAFRTCGMESPEKLQGKFFAPGSTADLEWKAAIEPNFLPETQADFFRGAIPLAGPFSARKMVMGLYNPHWHAILLVEVFADLPHSEEELRSRQDDWEEFREGALPDIPLPKVTRLLFTSGEAFLGEDPDEPDFSTVLPGGGGRGEHPDEPLSPGLWRAQVKVMRLFDALYPAQADAEPKLRGASLSGTERDRDLERLIARVAVRLKCLEGMHLDPERRAVAERMEKVLQLGLRSQMKRYFANPLHDAFVTTYAGLPREFKSGFRAYGCVANGEGTLYLLVNRDFPRLYATVSVPRGRLENPDAGTVDFEWYDLDQAEELLKVWEERPRN